MRLYERYLNGEIFLEEAYMQAFNDVSCGGFSGDMEARIRDKVDLEQEIIRMYMREHGYRYADEDGNTRIFATPEEKEPENEYEALMERAKNLGYMSSFNEMYFRDAVMCGNKAIHLLDNDDQKVLSAEEIYWAIKRQINAMMAQTRNIRAVGLAREMHTKLIGEWRWSLHNIEYLDTKIIVAEEEEIKGYQKGDR